MDMMLAGIHGRVICKELKARQGFNTPVMVISGTHNLAQVMNQDGAPEDFIAKHFDLDDVLKKIETLIN